jgi:2',3'-cyclic-nucleotide 2'-phosphodiesterase/3'-nucleotidase
MLPILSASAPFKTGGRAGPYQYTDIPAGVLTLRNAADLYPFPNSLCGLRLCGAEIADWLERAASCFNQLVPGRDRQPLWNPAFPGHAFDTIDGLGYEIDLSQPARYDNRGELTNPTASRVRNLRHGAAPLDPKAQFAVAANNYRAFGGGPYPVARPEALVHVGHLPLRDLLSSYIQNCGTVMQDTGTCWRFTALPGTSFLLETGPGLREYPGDISSAGAKDLGLTEQGFLLLELPL